jgi:Protein of unknown function (DUF732)
MTTTPPPNPQPLPSLALIGGLIVAIGAITAAFVLGRTKQDVFRSKDTALAASQTASALAADPPSQPKDRDGQFLWRIAVQGVQLRRSNDTAINDARRVCTRYAGGESEQQIIQDILTGSPGMSLSTASTFADTAISVYCPDGAMDGS